MRSILLSACAVCAACASTTVGAPRAEEARRAQQAGDHVMAYRLFAEALCRREASLETGRALVESWSALGRPGRVDQRLYGCKLPRYIADYVTGLAAATDGAWDVAVPALENAESSAPGDAARAEVGYRRGIVALEQGRHDDAITVLQRASGNDPLRVDARLALAQAQARARLYAECVATLRGVVAIPMRATDLERARRVLRNAVRAAEDPLPDATRAELQELLTVSERGVVDEQHIARVRELMSERRHAGILMVAGVLAMRAGDTASGTAWLNEATTLAPLDPDAPRALGVAFYAADRPSLALSPLREAARRDPFDVSVRGMLAVAAGKIGETDVGLEAYRALTVLSPRDPDNFLWVARLERKNGRHEAARVAAERGLAVQGDNIPLLVERAAISAQIALTEADPHLRRDAAERTREAVDELLAVVPGHPGAESIKKSVEGI